MTIPGIAVKHWPEILNCLEDKSHQIRHLTSRAAIKAGLDGDLTTTIRSKKDIIVDALKTVHDSPSGDEYHDNTVSESTIDQLMNSAYLNDRLMGIQLTPSVEDGKKSAFNRLIEILDHGEDNSEVCAALRALRSSFEARILFKLGDLRKIKVLAIEGRSDARKASIRLLGCFGADTLAVNALLELDLQSKDPDEFSEIIYALGRARVLKDEVSNLFDNEISKTLKPSIKRNKAYTTKITALLRASQTLAHKQKKETVSAVKEIISDYKQPEGTQRAALKAYPAIATPTQNTVEYLTTLIKSPPTHLLPEVISSLSVFSKNCTQNVDYVIACVESMSDLKKTSCELHKKLCTRNINAELENNVSDLRKGIDDINQIIITFEEFITTKTDRHE